MGWGIGNTRDGRGREESSEKGLPDMVRHRLVDISVKGDHWSLTSFSQELFQRIAAATGESLAAVARMAEEERRNLATVLGIQVRVGVELS